MKPVLKASSLLLLAAMAAGSAQAAVLDLGIGGANVYTLHNFTATNGSDVEGAIVAAGNVTVGSYSINLNNKDAYVDSHNNGYAAVAGGNLSMTGGSLLNGKYYAGSTTTLTNVGLEGSSASTVAPLSFATTSANVKASSLALSSVARTGTALDNTYGGLQLTGTGKSVEVFDLNASMLSNLNNLSSITGVNAGATLIFNVSGTAASFTGGLSNASAFDNRNVLWNFYQATTLGFNNVGVVGSILAPLASVNGGGGQINGNVIVDNWNSGVQINSNHYFSAADVAGYSVAAPVPEPETYAMLLAGLGAMALVARRRKPAGDAFAPLKAPLAV